MTALSPEIDYLHLFLSDGIYFIKSEFLSAEGEVAELPAPTAAQPVVSQEDAIASVTCGYAKRVLIVLSNQDGLVTKNELDFLEKVLKAVGLGWAEVSLLNAAQLRDARLNSLVDEFDPVALLIFGLGEQSLAFDNDIYPYFLQSAAGRTLLVADSLESIAQDSAKKKQLWNAIQKLPHIL